MEIDFIKGPKTNEIFGTSRCEFEINRKLKKDIKLNYIEYSYRELYLCKINISDALGSYLNYPLLVKRQVKNENIKHINPQNYAYLLKLLDLKKTIVTCHDLIPWIHEKNRSIPWKLNIKGLKKADRLITVSNFSKDEIIKYIDYPEDKIHVVYNAVNHDHYYKKRDKKILSKLNINDNFKVILYVGSEQPRQNVDSIINAFAKLKRMLPNVKLLKIGIPQAIGARENNLKLIEDLNLQKDVIFIDRVSEEDLPKIYNASDLFVYPCSYAGFGLPPLEAMACGTPVITSNKSSLPEVVGDAAIKVDPQKLDILTDSMYDVLSNDSLSGKMAVKGVKQSKMFNWNKAAKETLKVYQKVDNGD